ncbi:PIN domain-containing protein [Propioniciclava sp.]|uniref:PIN domain-containing protein n=1 Tax=Propioniciclava sp. TaxID=2038686 RepID=UPI0026116BD0|nr:PIN domain-containing protein [Propioniciclava sp.]
MADFLDTNVLVYAFDASEPTKQATAQQLLSDHPDACISTQVLLEWFSAVTRKFTPPLPLTDAVAALETLAALDVLPADAELVVRAARASRDHQLSIWDAMIIESAALGGCSTLWTEDLSDGTTLRGVTIRNPFAEQPLR